ncbi:MAG: hypothetical protein IT454_08065 [Planctomycetes bacterium]|nr:hypothetical protein [Planctomycetota bacterium]
MLACLLALTLALVQQPDPRELRGSLDALRAGQPGEAAFESALHSLPALLASRSGAFVAGAAHLAGKHARSECAPALIAALENENRRAANGSLEPTRAILDALVRLDVAAPSEVLLARPEGDLANLLYLALACEKDAAKRVAGLARLLELGWVASEAHWAAACRLAAARDPRLARWLISGAPWELCFAVQDAGDESGVAYSSGGGRWSTSHALWPPRAEYSLELPARGAALEAIAARRTEHASSGPMPRTLGVDERMQWRGRLLAALLERDVQLGPETLAASTTLVDGAELASALDAHVAAARERIRAALGMLAAAKLVTDPEPLLSKLRFSVVLSDQRLEPSAPIVWPKSSASVELVVR